MKRPKSPCETPDEQLARGMRDGNTRAIKAGIKRGADINASFNVARSGPEDWRTPLEFALLRTNGRLVKWLLQEGASPQVNLLAYSFIGDRPDLVAALARAGCNLCQSDEHGFTPLNCLCPGLVDIPELDPEHTRCIERIRKSVRILKQAGADINARYPDNGKTLLMNIIHIPGEPSLVKMLLEEGADPRIKDRMGRNSFRHAVGEWSPDLYDLMADAIGAPSYREAERALKKKKERASIQNEKGRGGKRKANPRRAPTGRRRA